MKDLQKQIIEEFEALPVTGMTTQEFICQAVERAYRQGKMDGASLIPDELPE